VTFTGDSDEILSMMCDRFFVVGGVLVIWERGRGENEFTDAGEGQMRGRREVDGEFE
jgi:hypothetical protein